MALPSRPSFREALCFWLRLGWISFGGPTGQIAIMHRELVERRKWIEESRFLNALNFCMMLPGPEAQQLATFLGWSLHGIRGGLCAGIFFVLPATFMLWGLSVIYVWYGSVPLVAAVFNGLVPAIIAIVFDALFKLGARTLSRPLHRGIALGSALLIVAAHLPYPVIIGGAGLLGWWTSRRSADICIVPDTDQTDSRPVQLLPQLRIALVCLVFWFAPVLVTGLCLGEDHTLTREGIFFSQTALVTFGGAYAVLPYVAQHAVGQYHWLTAEQMMHGFGLAETTPGPLVMVLQFVGFMGGWHSPGNLPPLAAATFGSLLTTWVTFAPSFLFILTGAPFIDRLIRIRTLQAALGAISAAVVGVMASFALWFAWHAIFPDGHLTHPDVFVMAVTPGAIAALRLGKIDTLPLIGLCALLGIAWRVALSLLGQ